MLYFGTALRIQCKLFSRNILAIINNFAVQRIRIHNFPLTIRLVFGNLGKIGRGMNPVSVPDGGIAKLGLSLLDMPFLRKCPKTT